MIDIVWLESEWRSGIEKYHCFIGGRQTGDYCFQASISRIVVLFFLRNIEKIRRPSFAS